MGDTQVDKVEMEMGMETGTGKRKRKAGNPNLRTAPTIVPTTNLSPRMLRIKKLLKVSILCSATALLCMGCDSRTVYHSYRNIPAGGWRKSDTLRFAFPVRDTLRSYRITVEVRNEDSYPYRELYLFLHRYNTRDSAFSVTDTLKCLLTNQEGKWKGTGVGAVYQSGYPFADLPILYTGDYQIGISHGMKDELLPGIDDIGIKVETIR